MSQPIIAAQGLSAGYGDLAAVRRIDLKVARGEVVALMGPNGAGKSTTLMTLAGWLSPMEGSVLWKGIPTTAPLYKRVRLGMGVITEQRSVFMGLSVAANLRLGTGEPERAFELFPELKPLSGRRAGLLSGGEQQILTVARVLAATPEVILADELSLGLAPLVVRRLMKAIRAAADAGAAVLLVEQHAHQALSIADRAYVMRRGEIALAGTAEEISQKIHSIEESYLAISSNRVSDTELKGAQRP